MPRISVASAGDQSAINPFTFNHTIASGVINGMLFVIILSRDTSSTDIAVSSVVLNPAGVAQSFTKAREDIVETAPASGTFVCISIWYLANPASGVGTIEVTATGGVNRWTACSALFSHMKQTSPVNASGTNNKTPAGGSTSISVSITTTKKNTVLISGCYDGDGSGISSDGTMVDILDTVIGGDSQGSSSTERFAAQAYTETWTDVVDDFAIMTLVAFDTEPSFRKTLSSIGTRVASRQVRET